MKGVCEGRHMYSSTWQLTMMVYDVQHHAKTQQTHYQIAWRLPVCRGQG